MIRILSLANPHLSNELIRQGMLNDISVTAYPAFDFNPDPMTIHMLTNTKAFDVLLITSRIAVQLIPLATMEHAQLIVAVGQSTRAAIQKRGITTPIQIPPHPSMKSIQTHLANLLIGRRVLYPRSADAVVSEPWFEALPATLIAPILYHPSKTSLRNVSPQQYDWIVVSSGQIARHLFQSFPNLSVPIICIGPETERALPPHANRVVSSTPSAADILSCTIPTRITELGDLS